MSSNKRRVTRTADDKHEQEQKKIKLDTMSAAATARRKDAAQPVKKLVIKNLKAAPKLPENFEEQTWSILEGAVRAVCHSQPTERSLEELYKAAEDLCYQKLAANLYVRLQKECEDHVKQEYVKLCNQKAAGPEYLSLIDRCWGEFCQHMTLIRSIFLHLDRTYVIQNSSIKSIWDMGLQIFRVQIASVADVEKKLTTGILQMIEDERKGQTVDRILLKNLSRMLVSLGMYHESLEKPFLQATVLFYRSEGAEKSRDMEVAEYLKHVEIRLGHENDRVNHYLDTSTRRPLITVVEKQLLEEHIESLVSRGTGPLVANNRKEDLARMYSLLSRVGGLPAFKSSFGTYIRTTGAAMVEDTEKEATFVEDLLEFRSKLESIMEESFIKNPEFAYTLRESFEHFINQKVNKPAELIAKFVDGKLRSGNKGASEDEMEQLLDRVMVLFRSIHGKDVFEAFYKKDLAKRLLLDKSASMDLEKAMISKLKTECGSAFTNKLEGMFKDVDLSSDIMSAFSDSKFQDELSGEMDMNVQVLTAGYWPAYTPIEIILPKNMMEYQEVFKKFYLSKYSGRKLTWQNSLGQCTLRAAFPAGTKELLVTLLQSVVLLLYNDTDKLTTKEIQQATGLQGNELKRTLLSLACGKVKVLNKEPSTKDISDDDTFEYNRTFKQKLHRIKINSVQIKETPEERQKTTATVMQDRQYQVDAAIVRIMKTRKQLSHSALISELFSQLKFPAQPADLKKRIESLIEREYMERSAEDSQVYVYMA